MVHQISLKMRLQFKISIDFNASATQFLNERKMGTNSVPSVIIQKILI